MQEERSLVKNMQEESLEVITDRFGNVTRLTNDGKNIFITSKLRGEREVSLAVVEIADIKKYIKKYGL